ncbi:ATP-binding protein [Rhodocytophaga aerolata]|uniref:ATP-binding protein n=1 Tax=Rhodocytophaga aerolata TaxID=455078 RepID=A0ABT8RG60_9BACT|nr:ATP-binding protein [Rhodocytophaga aerolata]MDO1451096.1 ATP-binding protein [Rhodocytophaga aerolata]
MSRKGGSATLSGVEYQALYTASRFAEAITEDDIISLRPEAHHTELPIPIDGQSAPLMPQQPAVDDLVIVHLSEPTEYISLKYRDGKGSWDVKQLIAREVLRDFFNQHQQDATARLILVSQSPMDRDLEDCVERVNTSKLDSLKDDLGAKPYQVFKEIEIYLQKTFENAALSRTYILRFIHQIEFYCLPAISITENLILRLQPHVVNASAVKKSLHALALRAGATQQIITPDSIRRKLQEEGYPLIVPPAINEVLSQLQQASSSLTSEYATIGLLSPHHITRPEIDELLAWILNPLPVPQTGDSAASQKSKILIGGAGVGKTVLTRSLCLALQNKDIPVLGLKADRVKGSTKGELLREIRLAGLHHPLLQALATVASPERPSVVIIDQLDALSMCLSAERGHLNSYTELLSELYNLTHIRIILSCRTFDLEHDPDLASFRQAQRIEVPLLSLAQVEEALQATHIAPNLKGISPVLKELLRVPLHLALYCALDEEDRGGMPISSLQGLYERLFSNYLVRRNRLPANLEPKRVKDYLTNLAVAMYNGQTLTLPRFKYQDQDEEVFEYLCSRGALVVTGPLDQQIAFFHQSFYEYLFARHFAVSDKSLADFVLSSGQGLFQRSLIQQVLTYLRGVNASEYILSLGQLLGSIHCRFHIRLLLTQQIASQSNPLTEEFSVVEDYILRNDALRLAFLEAVNARPWLEWLTSPRIFRQLIPEVGALDDTPDGRTLFWRLVNYAPSLAIEQVDALPENTHKREWIAYILFRLKAFKHPLFIPLFEKLFESFVTPNQQFIFWHILQEAVKDLPQWVASKMYEQLKEWTKVCSRNSQHENHQQTEIFKALYRAAPDICFNICSKLLRTWIRQANNYRDPYYKNKKSKYLLLPAPYSLEQDFPEKEETLRDTTDAVQFYAQKYLVDPTNYLTAPDRRTVKKWLHSRVNLLINISLVTIAAKPAHFTDAVFKLFLKPGWLAEATDHSFSYYCLTIFPVIWDAASLDQKQSLAKALTSRITLVDEEVYKYEGHSKFYTRFGRATLHYLLALSPERLSHFPELLQLYKELLRKWGYIPNSVPHSGVKVTSGYPSPAQHWKIDVIPAKNWLKALRKYRVKERQFMSEEGTYEGLLHHLTRLIKDNPSQWQPLVQYLIKHQDESVATLVSILYDANPLLASPLLEEAHQLGLLTDGDLRRICRNTRVDLNGNLQKADPEDIRAELKIIGANLDSVSTISGEKKDILMDALSSTGGYAVYNLLRENLPKEVIPEVVDTLRLVALKGSLYVRAGAVHHLAMLLNTEIPPQETVNLFVDLIGEDYELIEPGLWSLQYLVWRDYNTFSKLFRCAMGEKKAYEPMTKILTVLWGHDKAGAIELLKELWEIEPELKATSLEQLIKGYDVWPDKGVFFNAFALFLTLQPTEKLRRAYNFVFLHLPSDTFGRMAPLLISYLEACASKFDHDHYILEYLAQNIRSHARECITILDALFSQIPPKRNYVGAQRGLEILIEIYTSLSHHTSDSPESQAALNLLDKLLARPDCRAELNAVLAQV